MQYDNPLQYENPYAAPTSVTPPPIVAPVESAGELRLASQGARFLNMILDHIVIQVLSAVSGFAIGIVMGLMLAASNQPITPAHATAFQVAGWFIGLGVSLCYFILSEALFQRSLAKLLTGTRVVNEQGGRPRFGQIVGRSFARFIPFEAFSFLGANNPVGWHDRLSGTRVVRTR